MNERQEVLLDAEGKRLLTVRHHKPMFSTVTVGSQGSGSTPLIVPLAPTLASERLKTERLPNRRARRQAQRLARKGKP